MRRGRPRHPELFTPREQEVLALLREGLTNDQIAQRLGISRYGARYHVSEIMSKLGVSSRQEAAAWQPEPEPAGRRRFGAFALLLARLQGGSAGRIAASAALAAAIGGIVLLAAGVVLMSGRSNDDAAVAPTPSPDPEATATPLPTRTPQPDFVFAPDGRTGIPEVDDIIEALVGEDAAGLMARFGDVEAADVPLGPGINTTADQWTSRLAAALERSLYAVGRRGAEIILAVRRDDSFVEGWRFDLSAGQLSRVTIGTGSSPGGFLTLIEQRYRDYLVLPPRSDLPQPPNGHPLSVRTGEAGVDALLALIEARDVDGLLDAASFETVSCEGRRWMDACQDPAATQVEVLPAPRRPQGSPAFGGSEFCGFEPLPDPQERAYVERWIRAAVEQAVNVQRAFLLPHDHEPRAQHLFFISKQLGPFSWETVGFYVTGGRIVALTCNPTPPLPSEIDYVVAPPPDGELPQPSRRSGIAAVDAVLDAIEASDSEALEQVIEYAEVGCWRGPLGIGGPPQCRPDEPDGTMVEIYRQSGCHDESIRRDEAMETIDRLAARDLRLHSLVALGAGHPFGTWYAALVGPETAGGLPGMEAPEGVAIAFGEQGVTHVQHGCGPMQPEERIGRALGPTFLLPPP